MTGGAQMRMRAGHPLVSATTALRGAAYAILLGLLACAIGCDDDAGNDAIIPDADPAAPLAIVSPQSGAVVNSEAIEILGIGMRDAVTVSVRVHTDRWYAQSGALRVSSNNSWAYSPVYVSGQGAYNSHTIEVEVSHSDGRRERSAVSNVVRQ